MILAKKAVLIDLSKWGEIWEDFFDVLASESRKDEPTVPWQELKAEMDQGERLTHRCTYVLPPSVPFSTNLNLGLPSKISWVSFPLTHSALCAYDDERPIPVKLLYRVGRC